MKETLITKTKNTLRLALTPWEMFSHYGAVFFIYIIGLLPLWSIFEMKYLDSYDGVRNSEEIFPVSWPWLIIGTVVFVVQWRRLKMRRIKNEYTDDELNEAISRTAAEMEWIIANDNKRVLVAYRPWNWTGSWGERITIVKLKNGLLFNSICDPDKPSSIASFGWNKRNLKTFTENLIAVQKGEPAKLKKEEVGNESEWTFKKVLIRLIIYPLCLFFIALFCYFVYLHMNVISIIISVIPAAIAIIYLHSDIKIISGK